MGTFGGFDVSREKKLPFASLVLSVVLWVVELRSWGIVRRF